MYQNYSFCISIKLVNWTVIHLCDKKISLRTLDHPCMCGLGFGYKIMCVEGEPIAIGTRLGMQLMTKIHTQTVKQLGILSCL